SRSALARYTPDDFLALLARHRIAWHEKHRGQLFCDDSSESIIEMLRHECNAAKVQWRMGCTVHAVRQEQGHQRAPIFVLDTADGMVQGRQLVIACGG